MITEFAKIETEDIRAELLRFKSIMDVNRVPFFLISGTCLGAARNGELIPWDKDIDIGVLDSPEFRNLPLLFAQHYDAIDVHNEVEKGAYFFLIRRLSEDRAIIIEVRAFYAGGADKAFFNMTFGRSLLYKEVHLAWPIRLFREFKSIHLFGEKFPSPSPVEEYLEIMYGPDWKTPREYTDWRHNTSNVEDGYYCTEKRIAILGASRGIGWVLANACAQHNFVGVCSRTIAPKETAGYLAARCDVRNPADVTNFVRQAKDKFGKIDVVIFNAGIMRHDDLLDAEMDDWKDLASTIVDGYLSTIKAVIPFMLEQSSGYFINISSTRGVKGFAGRGLYCAAKHAAKALTDTINEEYNDRGICATSLHLGVVDTESSQERYGQLLQEQDPIGEYDVLKTVRWLISLSANAKPRSVIVGGRI